MIGWRQVRGGWMLGVTALALALPGGGGASAADFRFGYVDSARIFREYQPAVEAQQRFDRMVQGWKDEAAEKDKAVKKLRDELRDQGPMLSALKRQEKEEAVQRAVGDYQQYIQDTWGPQGRAVHENEQATNEVLNQIRSAVEKVAADKGLTLVLDTNSGLIVYADRSLDITSDVIGELNARLKLGGTH
jgi:Skp family chaperone for outer membrane proteins